MKCTFTITKYLQYSFNYILNIRHEIIVQPMHKGMRYFHSKYVE